MAKRAARATAKRVVRSQRVGVHEAKTHLSRLLREVTALSQAFALAVPHPDVLVLRDDISFFQAVRAGLAKILGGGYDAGGLDSVFSTQVRFE